MADDPQKRLITLREEIHLHSFRYHVLDDPIISDVEFDRLLNELKAIEASHPEWITPDSPTQRAGAVAADKFEKVRHPNPILSLSNAFNSQDIRAWYERNFKLDERIQRSALVVEPKIDGLTVVLHYRNGVLAQGTTRGDGEIGEDITSNLRTVRAIPLRIPVDPQGPKPPPYLAVRAEAFITLHDFEALNRRLQEAGEKTYLNPRNTAAGSLRQLDPALTASRPLTILSYAIVAAEGTIPTTQWETLMYLKALGFPVSDLIRFCPTLEEAISVCTAAPTQRDQWPFEADGMVIKLNDLQLSADLGIVGKDPRGAVAVKFPAREVTTRLQDIGVNVGRTGVITPYAILEPVEVGGVVVRQATLHNFDFIAEKDIRILDRVLIKRAGDVIPYVIGPIASARTGEETPYQIPATCPACGQPIENIAGEVAWYCVNAACPAQLVRNLEHFVSRPALDINGLGIKIVEQFAESGLVRDVADIFTLKRDPMLTLEGFGEKKADNLLAAIENARQKPLSRLINALGIHGVGEVMANDLAKVYSDLDLLSHASTEDLQAIEGIGPNIAAAIVEWFSRPANQMVLAKLKSAGVWPTSTPQAPPAPGTQPLAGMTFVITGTLPNLSRDQARELIQNNGGKVTDSISKKTSYLLLGAEPGSKLTKAQELGVSVIDEAAFLTLIGKA